MIYWSRHFRKKEKICSFAESLYATTIFHLIEGHIPKAQAGLNERVL